MNEKVGRLVMTAFVAGMSVLVGIAPEALAAPEGPGRHGTEFIDVVPSNHLEGQASVQVSGTGFPPSARLAVTECLAVSVGADDCDLSTLDLTVTTRPDGSFGPLTFRVRPAINVASRPEPVACGTEGCAVGVGTLDEAYGGSHCLGFGGTCRAAPAASPPPSTSGPSEPPTAPATTPVTTAPTSSSGSTTTTGSESGGSNAGLVVGVIILVVVGIVVAIIGIRARRHRS